MTYFSLEFSLMMIAFFALYWAFGEKDKNLSEISNKNDKISSLNDKNTISSSQQDKKLKAQNLLILFFSYTIYTLINPYFALVLFVYTFFIHYFALLIFVRQKRLIFALCIIFVVLNLCFFKYFESIKDSFEAFLSFFGFEYLNADITFPIGISFYTFASITYLVSVYQNKKLESFLNLATYLSFFPTLLLGPIMRSEFFFAQIHKKRHFENANLIIILLLFGIVKKVLIANYLGIYAKPILANPAAFNFLELICAIYAFSVQIYCDFSGYVDLVCAFALMLGFKLPPNFNMPYLAKNLREFWTRWHISLSTFIRDYIYIPLGGSRKSTWRTYLNLLIAFVISGIWHGNTLNFFIWGLLHGLGVIFLHLPFIKRVNFSKIPYLSVFITFHFVAFAWIFFYYPNFDGAIGFLKACVNNFFEPVKYSDIYVFAAFAGLFVIYPLFINFRAHCVKILSITPLPLKPIIIAFLLLLIFAFMPSGIPQFIYESF